MPLAAGTPWDAQLHIAPYPSPYLSDWETNPTIATLTISNPTGADQEVLLVYRVRDPRGRQIASGRSDPQLVLAGPATVLTDFVNMAGSSSHDGALEDQMRRTGRLPEGEYSVCVTVTDRGGFILAEDCATFTILYPAPPQLIAPFDGEAIVTGHPLLQWTPLGVPPIYQLSYVVRVSEVLPGQVPAQALAANIPVFEGASGLSAVEYPLAGRPLELGRTYAWQVQALDQHGYAAAAAEGRSEIRTFRYDPADGTTGEAVPVRFSLYNGQQADADGDAPGPPTSYGISEICAHWDTAPPEELQLGVNSPFGFVGFRADQAFLYRQTDPANKSLPRQWWVFAQTGRGRSVLMSGNCGGKTFGVQLSGLQWVAWRKDGRAQKINDFIDGLTTSGTDLGLAYGVFVVAVQGGSTVSAPAGFAQGAAFLEGHEFDVARGINLYAVVQLPEGPVWGALQALGYDRNQLTLQGFAGLDVSRAVGVGGNDGFEASASQEKTYLLATVAFPEREAIGPLGVLAESMQLSLELEIKDSTGVNLQRDTTSSSGVKSQTNYSREWIYRLKHTINLREELFPRGDESRALVGWIGADQAGERSTLTPGPGDVAAHAADKMANLKRALTRVSGGRLSGVLGDTTARCLPRADLEWKTELAINYGLSGKLYTIGPVFLEDPALEVHVGKPMANGQRELTVGFAAGIGVEGYAQQGVVGISRSRSGPDGEPADPTCKPSRPRSSTVTDAPTRPRANADADPTTPSGRNPTMPPSDAGTPLHAEWEWSWKVAWEVAPVGALGKVVNGGLGVLFLLIGLGGG